MARGAHAQCEEAVVRHVVCELAKQRRAELRAKVSVRASASDDTHLVAEASVAATDAFLVAGAHGEAHDAVEAGGTGLSRRCACGVGVVVKVGGRGATYVGVAADSVFPDCVGAVESEECQWYARGLLGALHLQDCTDDK